MNQICLNTIGSIDSQQCSGTVVGFECPCKEGYQPSNDGTDCVGEYNLHYNNKLPVCGSCLWTVGQMRVFNKVH